MTKEEAARIIDPATTREALAEIEYYAGFNGHEAVIKAVEDACMIGVEALRQTADKDCSQCKDKDRCAIHDNFNIDYCSDWRLP